MYAQAAPRPRRFKETTNSKWDDYYEAESPPSYPHLQRISSARQGSYSHKALLLLSGTPPPPAPRPLLSLSASPCCHELQLILGCSWSCNLRGLAPALFSVLWTMQPPLVTHNVKIKQPCSLIASASFGLAILILMQPRPEPLLLSCKCWHLQAITCRLHGVVLLGAAL